MRWRCLLYVGILHYTPVILLCHIQWHVLLIRVMVVSLQCKMAPFSVSIKGPECGHTQFGTKWLVARIWFMPNLGCHKSCVFYQWKCLAIARTNDGLVSWRIFVLPCLIVMISVWWCPDCICQYAISIRNITHVKIRMHNLQIDVSRLTVLLSSILCNVYIYM